MSVRTLVVIGSSRGSHSTNPSASLRPRCQPGRRFWSVDGRLTTHLSALLQPLVVSCHHSATIRYSIAGACGTHRSRREAAGLGGPTRIVSLRRLSSNDPNSRLRRPRCRRAPGRVDGLDPHVGPPHTRFDSGVKLGGQGRWPKSRVQIPHHSHG
jgi:hypothetical protein